MSPRFAVVHSRDYAKQYPESEIAELEAECVDSCYLCVDTLTGRVLGQDGGEPKDQMLIRSWRWVPRELNALNADVEQQARERDDAREKLRALVEAASALCRDAANRGELKDEMRDSWDACFNAIGAARGVL